jgi:hypothetical protein
MIAAPHLGFAFLAMPKCASSSIEPKLIWRGMISMPRNPALKHMPAAQFERLVVPLLEVAGYRRRTYETVCLFREPIEWLHSWWRYRSREALAAPGSPGHKNYTGHVTFEEFADAYIAGRAAFAQIGSQAEFVRGLDADVGVDRIFRYESLDLLVGYLTERLGIELELDRRNASPMRELEISAAGRERLRRHLRMEYRIYDGLTPSPARESARAGDSRPSALS